MESATRKPISRRVRIAGYALAGMTVSCVIGASLFDRSLPYRIGLASYPHYLWAGRLYIAALILGLPTIVIGAASRLRLPVILPLVSLLYALLTTGGAHSGPNPEAWCYSNLREIEGAKLELAEQSKLTNGTPVRLVDIAPFVRGGIEHLKCYENGRYILGPIGTEPSCSVHGVSR